MTTPCMASDNLYGFMGCGECPLFTVGLVVAGDGKKVRAGFKMFHRNGESQNQPQIFMGGLRVEVEREKFHIRAIE
jgi:hypothetical protein